MKVEFEHEVGGYAGDMKPDWFLIIHFHPETAEDYHTLLEEAKRNVEVPFKTGSRTCQKDTCRTITLLSSKGVKELK